MRRHLCGRALALAFSGVLIILWCSLSLADQTYRPDGPGQIDLHAGILVSGGRPWQMKGVIVVGRLTPIRRLRQPFIGEQVRIAQRAFGVPLLEAVRAFGANTIIIKVSEPGLNPSSLIYEPGYGQYAADAIKLSRSMGFTVIISMQWEPGSGSLRETGLPDANAQAAWTTLLSMLDKADNGLLFELLNEPNEKPSEGWDQWRIGHNSLIQLVRHAGFEQLLIVDGIHGAHILENAPDLNDPANKVIYGVHPYLNAGGLKSYGPRDWDGYFGNFCRTRTCLATEWNGMIVIGGPSSCGGDLPQVADQLLRYLWQRRMGIAGWAFDFPNTLLKDSSLVVPTDYNAWGGSCRATTKTVGAGKLLHDFFLSTP